MSLVSMAGIVGPALFAGCFGFFIGPRAPVHLPGAPFLIAGLLLGVAWIIAWRYARAAPVPAPAPAATPPR
jgi:DHA1 family tetracycline resistance protein-like MFS transporter